MNNNNNNNSHVKSNANQFFSNNVIMNNYITIENNDYADKMLNNQAKLTNNNNNLHDTNYQNMNLINHPHHSIHQKEKDIERIMTFFNKRYMNILPHKLNANFDFKALYFPFDKAHLIELLYQLDICVQLIIQNFLFATNEDVKFKTYDLLFKIFHKKEFVVSFLASMPSYQIYLSKFKVESAYFPQQTQNTDHYNKTNNSNNKPNYSNKYSLWYEAKPQLSILQTPLLEFANVFVEIKRKFPSKEKLRETLFEFSPLINKYWIPIFKDPNGSQPSTRTKFSYIDESLLLIGLAKYGTKKLELIQENFLFEKTAAEIKNRYKNFICSRASDNQLKRWKILQFSPLTTEEKIALQRAVEWFGSYDKLYLITRYFLTDRNPDYLKSEITGSEKLQQKREKYASYLEENPNMKSTISQNPNVLGMSYEEKDCTRKLMNLKKQNKVNNIPMISMEKDLLEAEAEEGIGEGEEGIEDEGVVIVGGGRGREGEGDREKGVGRGRGEVEVEVEGDEEISHDQSELNFERIELENESLSDDALERPDRHNHHHYHHIRQERIHGINDNLTFEIENMIIEDEEINNPDPIICEKTGKIFKRIGNLLFEFEEI